MASILVPFAYLIIVFGGLFIFSHYYRKHTSTLVRRAMADVQRVLRIREDKPALQALLQKGSIGDELWNSLLAAEKELEVEIMEVINEANSFVEGWGQVIFPTANEMIANEKMRAVFEHTAETKAELEIKYEYKAKTAALPAPPSSPLPVKANGLLSPSTPRSDNMPLSDAESTGTPKSKAKSKRRK
ncbi:hypothetical protein FA13DRAFT_1732744 [Coprinellus micaceus]|uniref:Translocation protein sec66 n=1 Tax=Coprinellus micaceus TaxID=71717 RepID=A0A4Y7TCK0_COPMI|nr:hypothetical protein FA13DRAFT_1732744 [Coprinellus micaceus]